MSQTSERDVLEALRPIQDPDFKRSIVDLGFVKNVRIDGGKVAFAIELTTPACPVKERFEGEARAAVGKLPGVTSVEVTMTAQTRGSTHAQKPEGLEGVKNVIAVASGKGGVGKSTISVNLALALAESGARVGLLDCDVYGPSIPLMLHISGRPQVTPDKKIHPLQSYGLKLMSIGFLAGENAPVIWRGPMVHGIIRQFLSDVKWGDLDYLVLDLPPGTGDAALTICQTAPLAGALIVTTPQEVALIDARKGLQMFQRVNVPVLGIVENMSWFTCDGCGKRHTLFGQGGAERAARELGTDVLGHVPLQPDVVEAGDSGKPTMIGEPESAAAREIRALAGLVARKLSLLNAEAPPVIGTNIEWVNTP
ncbi:MAG TPA: Mrp/NBP35 family ATP-binding protein [Myxococcota bacterium]|nr:Mrp/NBP35 family ATP-binding protein [Myxococcota bacterium]